MSIHYHNLHQTQVFLDLLHSCQENATYAGDLAVRLVEALNADGYALQEIEQPVFRSLRGLAESSEGGGGVNVIALVMVAVCVLCAGLASGLTQGLLSLDQMEMEIKARSGTEEEKKYSAKLIPIITRHHLLLVTLMLWNASATEALPIFLAALVPEYVAIIISVTLVLFVGEIIPASILTGPRQLEITASLTPLVYLVLVLFFPIAYPISLGLDYVIGHSDMTMYNRTEISTMMQLHREEGVKRANQRKHHDTKNSHNHNASSEDMYEEEEVTIIAGALKYREMTVSEVMTIAENVFMISVTDTLNYKLIYEIFKAGYSRIPVFEKDRDDIVGLILAKDMIFVDPEDETPVRSFMDLFGRKPAVVWHDSKLGETLSMFKAEKSHMAIVRDVEYPGEGDPYYTVVGIITLEDIVEEILGTEIEDETDVDHEAGMSSTIRDPELARLRTIQTATVLKDSLSEEEVHSIGIYLFTNVPQIQRMFRNDMTGLQKLVRSSAVISLTRKAEKDEKPSQEDYLYRKGKMTTTCTLVLEGSVEVVSEEGSVGIIRGPWSTLAVGALESAEGTFVPDFSASVASEQVRFLRLSNFQSAKPTDGNSTAAGVGSENTPTTQRSLQHKSKSAYAFSPTSPPVSGTTTIAMTKLQSGGGWADAITYNLAPLRPRGRASGTGGVIVMTSTADSDHGRRVRGASWNHTAGEPMEDTVASPLHLGTASSHGPGEKANPHRRPHNNITTSRGNSRADSWTALRMESSPDYGGTRKTYTGKPPRGGAVMMVDRSQYRAEEEEARNPILEPARYSPLSPAVTSTTTATTSPTAMVGGGAKVTTTGKNKAQNTTTVAATTNTMKKGISTDRVASPTTTSIHTSLPSATTTAVAAVPTPSYSQDLLDLDFLSDDSPFPSSHTPTPLSSATSTPHSPIHTSSTPTQQHHKKNDCMDDAENL